MTKHRIIGLTVVAILIFGILWMLSVRLQSNDFIPNKVKIVSVSNISPEVVLEPGKSTMVSLDRSFQYLDEVREDLSKLDIESKSVKALIDDFDDIKSILFFAHNYDNSGYTVNILLQVHADDRGYTDEAKESQALCYATLAQLQASLVGIEAFDSDDLNLSEKVSLTHAYLNDSGSLVSYEQTKKVVMESLSQLGSYQYVVNNARAKGFGIERRSMIIAHTVIADLASKDEKYGSLFMKIAILRSDYALARALMVLRSSGQKEVSIVIGAHHGLDMITIARRYNMKVNFYATLTGPAKMRFLRRIKMFEN